MNQENVADILRTLVQVIERQDVLNISIRQSIRLQTRILQILADTQEQGFLGLTDNMEQQQQVRQSPEEVSQTSETQQTPIQQQRPNGINDRMNGINNRMNGTRNNQDNQDSQEDQ